MRAGYELRQYAGKEQVWVGRYKNARNLLHWHYDCELIYVNEGTIAITLNGGNYVLSAGQSFFIDSGAVHNISSSQDSVLSMFIFDSKLVKGILQGRCLKSPVLTGDYNILEIFNKVQKELTEKQPFFMMGVNCAMVQLMIAIFRYEETAPRKETDASTVGRYKELLQEIDQKFAYYTRIDAAKFMGQNAQYFSTFFHRTSGVTFTRYLNEVRIEKAVELLKSEMELPITEVAARCGFDTIRNFNRVFKSVLGFSPKQLTKDFVMAGRTLLVTEKSFDPTLEETELLATE